jgi:hypothetical protein
LLFSLLLPFSSSHRAPTRNQNLKQNIHKSFQEAKNPKHNNERLLPPPLLGFNDDNAMDDTMKTMKNRG